MRNRAASPRRARNLALIPLRRSVRRHWVLPVSYPAFDPDLRSSQDDAVLQFYDTAFGLLSRTGLSAGAGCPVMSASRSAVIASSFLAGHPLPDPEPETGRSVLRALLPPSFTCSSVQAFILPATCEYCTEGLHMAREAFLRAENGAAPPRARTTG